MTKTVLLTDYEFPDLNIEHGVLDEADIKLISAQVSSEAELLDVIDSVDAPIDGLITQYAPITSAVLDALNEVQVVGRYGIGVDNVDIDAATKKGVHVVNVPSYCEDEVAEHTLSLLLSCTRKIPTYNKSVKKQGDWDWSVGQPIERITGKTLGIAGFGKIPRVVISKAAGFDLEVIAFDPYVDSAELTDHGIEKVEFDELLERSDLISIHTPLTDETEGMFDATAFEKMQESAYIVNTSRGAVIDTDALNDALQSEAIAGAGLDVLPEEPPQDLALLDRDDIVVSPHVAWYSEQSIIDLRRTVAEDVAGILAGDPPMNPVNSL